VSRPGAASHDVQHGRNAFADRVEVVAALEHGYEASLCRFVGEATARRRHHGEAGGGDVEAPQRVAAVAVEAGGDEDEVRRELARDREDDLVERACELGIAEAGGERQVERPAGAGAGADLGDRAGPGIDAVLVRRHVEDARVVLEEMLRAVAVMQVPVDDADAADTRRAQRRRGDGNVVEEAETHRARVLGVMARRTHERKAIRDLAGTDGLAEVDEPAGGEARGVVRVRRRRRVGVEHDVRVPRARRHARDVARVVDARELGVGRRPRADAREPRGVPPPIEQDAQAIRPLGMSAARIVREHAIVEHDSGAAGHAATIPIAPTN
jgi:hypothetical protein